MITENLYAKLVGWRERVKELDQRIADYPCWGAALTAMDEERRGLHKAIALAEAHCAHANVGHGTTNKFDRDSGGYRVEIRLCLDCGKTIEEKTT